MDKPRKPFPRTTISIGLGSLPFWYIVFVKGGQPPLRVALACVVAALVILLVAVILWRRTNRPPR